MTGRLRLVARPPVASSLLDRVGGEDGLTRLLERFYYHMDTRPSAAVVRAMHGDDLESMVVRLSRFLAGWLRATGRERISIIPMAHMRFAIGVGERDEWLAEPVADLCRTDEAAGDF